MSPKVTSSKKGKTDFFVGVYIFLGQLIAKDAENGHATQQPKSDKFENWENTDILGNTYLCI